jgi:hypothetical protein
LPSHDARFECRLMIAIAVFPWNDPSNQHLADPVAYRRDRRKDQLLQENGYLVLRFLAEDVGRELDLVLDAILRVLSQRRAVSTTATLQFVRRGRT